MATYRIECWRDGIMRGGNSWPGPLEKVKAQAKNQAGIHRCDFVRIVEEDTMLEVWSMRNDIP